MPDLSLEGAHRYWNSYPDKIIYKVVTFMEGVEDWTLDGDPQVEAAINKLGETLEDVGGVDLKREEDFIKLAAYIKASRNLWLLQSLDTAHPGAASKLLIHAENNTASTDDIPGLFLRRNIVFERLRLLSRVFSAERFKTVLNVLEEKE